MKKSPPKHSSPKPARKPQASPPVLPVNERFRLSPLQIRLTETDDGIRIPGRIQLFRTGRFQKWDEQKQRWTEFEITREMLAEMVENFENKVRGVDIALDFAHKSDEEAAGWLTKLHLEDTPHDSQLWADVDWTPDGRAAVGGKKFRYISPDFAFAWKDNETGRQYGPTLFGAGLTNRPVIKNMAPTVELTEVDEMAKKKLAKKISEMSKEELELKLAEETDEEKKELIELRLAELSEGGDDDGDADGDDDEEEDMPAKKKKKLDEMTMDEMKAAYQKVCDELAELQKKVATQASELEKQAKVAQKREMEATFSKLLAEGKVVPAQKEAFMAGDAVKFAELSQPVKLKTIGATGAAVEGDKKVSAQDKVLKLAEEKKKQGVKAAEAVSLVLSENPDLRAQYEQEMEAAEAEA